MLCALCLASVFFCGYYVNLKKNIEVPAVLKNQTDNIIKFVPYEKRTWSIYTDDQYKYSISLPAQLNVFHVSDQGVVGIEATTSGSFIRKRGVGFGDMSLDNYWVVSISISEKTNFMNTGEWLKGEEKKFEHQRPVIEKRIIIGGNDAIVTHMHSDYEIDEVTKNEKNTVFIKSGNLFEIRTRFAKYINHERVWNSFKFNQ